MPHNHFALWHQLWDALPEPVKAAALAVIVTLLRVMYDDREPRLLRRGLEAALCGAITFGAVSGLEALGAAQGWGAFVGGVIGLLGADKVRELGHRYARRRIDRECK